jgi:hypothetical protein
LNILNDVRAVTDSEMNCFLNTSLLQLHQQAAGAARQTNTLTAATVVTYVTDDFPKQRYGVYVNAFRVKNEETIQDQPNSSYRTLSYNAFKISSMSLGNIELGKTNPSFIQATSKDKELVELNWKDTTNCFGQRGTCALIIQHKKISLNVSVRFDQKYVSRVVMTILKRSST